MAEHQIFAILRVESPGQVIMQLQPSASTYALKNSYGLFLRRSGKRSMKGDEEGAPEIYFSFGTELTEPVIGVERLTSLLSREERC